MTISVVDDRPVQESGAGDEFGGVVRIADIRYVT
jgi:exosome complex component CSL4